MTAPGRAAAAAALGILGRLGRRARPSAPRRILVIAAGWLGDTFWALQAVPEIRAAYPAAEIRVAVRSPFLPLLRGTLPPEQGLPVDSVVSDRTRERFRPGAFLRDVRRARAFRPDLVFDLMGNVFSALFARGAGAFTAGSGRDGAAARLYGFASAPDREPGPHLAYRPRAVARQYLGNADSPALVLRLPEPALPPDEVRRRRGFTPEKRIALLVPGAGWAAKRWAPERFRELAGRLTEAGWAVAVSVSPAEHGLYLAVAAGRESSVREVNDLEETLSLLPLCALCVGNDTGIMHIAEAYPCPCVSLYCATNPEFSCGTGEQVRALAAACPLAPLPGEQYCRFRRLACPRQECMDIAVDTVWNAIRAMTETRR